jgi:hypothetical protein
MKPLHRSGSTQVLQPSARLNVAKGYLGPQAYRGEAPEESSAEEEVAAGVA